VTGRFVAIQIHSIVDEIERGGISNRKFRILWKRLEHVIA
jgi:hypothetical protein